jgi:hypothetical protein
MSQDPLAKAIFAGESLEPWIKYMDQGPFNKNHALLGSRKTNCTVAAFTSAKLGKPGEREIYLNHSAANETTVVHELFHYFTHPAFDAKVSLPFNEAVTEYFTRKTLKGSKHSGFDLAGRKGRYEDHHWMLTEQRKQPKQGNPGDSMKKAYFQATRLRSTSSSRISRKS